MGHNFTQKTPNRKLPQKLLGKVFILKNLIFFILKIQYE
jgi:hypothetical protein